MYINMLLYTKRELFMFNYSTIIIARRRSDTLIKQRTKLTVDVEPRAHAPLQRRGALVRPHHTRAFCPITHEHSAPLSVSH